MRLQRRVSSGFTLVLPAAEAEAEADDDDDWMEDESVLEKLSLVT